MPKVNPLELTLCPACKEDYLMYNAHTGRARCNKCNSSWITKKDFDYKMKNQ